MQRSDHAEGKRTRRPNDPRLRKVQNQVHFVSPIDEVLWAALTGVDFKHMTNNPQPMQKKLS